MSEWCDKICDRIKCLRSKTSGITDSINHNFAIIRIDSYDSSTIEKRLTFHNVIILIKSVGKKYKNNYYYYYYYYYYHHCYYYYYSNIFLKKVCIKINPIQNIFK